MKKLLSTIAIALILSVCITCFCGCSSLKFKANQVYSIYFDKFVTAPEHNRGYINRSTSEYNSTYINQKYEMIKNIKFIKLRSRNIMNDEIEYHEPSNCDVVTFYYEGGCYILKIYAGRVYKDGIYNEYSSTGANLLSDINYANLTIENELKN